MLASRSASVRVVCSAHSQAAAPRIARPGEPAGQGTRLLAASACPPLGPRRARLVALASAYACCSLCSVSCWVSWHWTVDGVASGGSRPPIAALLHLIALSEPPAFPLCLLADVRVGAAPHSMPAPLPSGNGPHAPLPLICNGEGLAPEAIAAQMVSW